MLRLKESGRIVSQSRKGSVCNRCGDLHIEDAAGVFVGKRRQSAVIGKRHDRIEIILSIVRSCLQSNAEDSVLQIGRIGFTKGVFQFLDDTGRILLLRLPQGKWLIVPIIGVGHIEHMAQVRPVTGVVDQRNAFRAAIDPSIEYGVPQFDRGAGGGVGMLHGDQYLVSKGILVEPSRRVQKTHPSFRRFGEVLRRFSAESGDAFKLGSHTHSPHLSGSERCFLFSVRGLIGMATISLPKRIKVSG